MEALLYVLISLIGFILFYFIILRFLPSIPRLFKFIFYNILFIYIYFYNSFSRFSSIYLFFFFFIFHITFLILYRYYHLHFNRSSKSIVLGFLHPNALQLGGGERVLFCLYNLLSSKILNNIDSLFLNNLKLKHLEIIIYIQPDLPNSSSKATLSKKVKELVNNILNIEIPAPKLVLIPTFSYHLHHFPIFSRLFETLSALIPLWDIWLSYPPHIIFDTSGIPISFPFFRYIADCYTFTYIHYPYVIPITEKKFSYLYSIYSSIVNYIYFFCGKSVDLAVVNSSWTKKKMKLCWKRELPILYPPCEITNNINYQDIEDRYSHLWFVSLAQFRPEKGQNIMIMAFQNFLSKISSSASVSIKLLLCGSDPFSSSTPSKYLLELYDIIKYYNLSSNIDIFINLSSIELSLKLRQSLIGLHIMKEEHFGISIVEMMDQGLIPLVHASGGPLNDICKAIPISNNSQSVPSAFFVHNWTDKELIEEISSTMMNIYDMYNSKEGKITLTKMQQAARLQCKKFSREVFNQEALSYLSQAPILSKYLNA